MPVPIRDESPKFFEKVRKTATCWLWLGATGPLGHGVFRRNGGSNCPAHCWAYSSFVGVIPSKTRILHNCGKSNCVNPAHLFLGTPENMLRRKSAPGQNGCVEWTGATITNGYGQIGIAGKIVLAHRLAWGLRNGPIPAGQCVLHHCDNRQCINPDHLFLGSKTENNNDRDNKGRAARGEALSDLSARNNLAMRAVHKTGFTIAETARLFDKPHNTVSSIVKRRTWKHI